MAAVTSPSVTLETAAMASTSERSFPDYLGHIDAEAWEIERRAREPELAALSPAKFTWSRSRPQSVFPSPPTHRVGGVPCCAAPVVVEIIS